MARGSGMYHLSLRELKSFNDQTTCNLIFKFPFCQVPSRSARRKKAKRQWLKELKKAEKKDDSCHSKGLLHWKQERAKTKKKEVVSHPKPKGLVSTSRAELSSQAPRHKVY
ncbi:hypothetical protein LguiA_032801 [Lonicera macranthoides]